METCKNCKKELSLRATYFIFKKPDIKFKLCRPCLKIIMINVDLRKKKPRGLLKRDDPLEPYTNCDCCGEMSLKKIMGEVIHIDKNINIWSTILCHSCFNINRERIFVATI